MANTVKHKTLPAGTDRPGFSGVTPSLYAEEHSFAGGALGSVLVRNTGASDGASWVATANGVLIATGAGVLPSFGTTLPNAVQDNITRTGTITSGTWNTSNIGVSSQAAGDILYATGATTLSRLNGSGLLKLNGSSAPTVVAGMHLLFEASGTASDVAATNVSTYALASQLTVKDTLLVISQYRNTGSAANITASIYNSTDSVTIGALTQANNNYYIDATIIGAQTATLIASSGILFSAASIASTNSTFTTNWTGAWTIALRHGGITAPDTWVWSWRIYKIAGQ